MNFPDYLKGTYCKWAWLGQRAHDGWGVNHVLGLDLIISCDEGLETKLFFDKTWFSLEAEKKKRLNWSNEDLGSSLQTEYRDRFLEYLKRTPGSLNVLAYRSATSMEELSKQFPSKLRICSATESLKSFLDNKVLFREKLKELDLPFIPGKIINLGSYILKERELPVVIQFPYGSSGSSTYMVKTERRFKELTNLFRNHKVNMLEYLDGFSINVNGIVLSETGIYCSYPSVQLVGLPECSNSATVFCGNDYSATERLTPHIIEKIRYTTERIGIWLAREGFRGVFGVDMLVKDGELFPVEVNPRFQNSTGLFTMLEIAQERKDLLIFLHIAEFLREDKNLQEYTREFDKDLLMEPLFGSQVILHNLYSKVKVSGQVMPGVYRFSHNKELEFVRSGVSLLDCKDSQDFLVTCGVPEKDKTIEEGAAICKIQTRKSLLGQDLKTLKSEISEFITELYKAFSLEKI